MNQQYGLASTDEHGGEMLDDLQSLKQILLLPPLDFCIENLLPRGGLAVLGGTPKDGKSVIVLDLVLRGVQGRTAFGRYNQNYKKVLVVNVEGRHQGIKMRDVMYKDLSEATQEKILVSGKPMRFTLPSGETIPQVFYKLTQTIVDNEIELVVLDPLVSFHAGDENDSQQMVRILDELRSVGERTKASFIIIHHTRKMGSKQTLEEAIEQGATMLRGAGGIFGAVDSAIMLWATGVKRLVTFACRYARGDTTPIELQMDKNNMRMYPIKNGTPDFVEWCKDNPPDREAYNNAFGITPVLQMVAKT
jgi:hypothetical protein